VGKALRVKKEMKEKLEEKGGLREGGECSRTQGVVVKRKTLEQPTGKHVARENAIQRPLLKGKAVSER